MTRVTAPMSQLARSLTAGPSVARPNFVSRTSKAAAALAHADFSADGRSSDSETSRRSMTTAHRPATVQPNPGRVVPLMQTFHSSAAPAARLDSSTLDFAVLPILDAAPVADAAHVVRMPLLPDNFAPDRSAFAPEVPDAPLPPAEISVMTPHPESVLSVLTEVEGIGIDGVELKFVHEPEPLVNPGGHGMLKDVWSGLLDDVFGVQKKPALA